MPTIFDTRGCPISEGDEVIYGIASEIKTSFGLVRHIEITNPRWEISKVALIIIEQGTGWCHVGDAVTVTLEDGHVERGDTENGGWSMLRLPDKQAKRRNVA